MLNKKTIYILILKLRDITERRQKVKKIIKGNFSEGNIYSRL